MIACRPSRHDLAWLLRRTLERLAAADVLADLAPYRATLATVTAAVERAYDGRRIDDVLDLLLQLDYAVQARAEVQDRAQRVAGGAL